MGYVEGAMTSATPAADLATIIMNELIMEGGLFVETYTAGANTIHVMEIPAAASPLSQKWYLLLHYATSAGLTLNLTAAEDWNSGSKLAIRGAYYGSNASFTLDTTTGSRYGATGQAVTFWQSFAISLRTTSFAYGFVIDGACVVGNAASNAAAGYVGQMIPGAVVKAQNDLTDGYYPLAVINGALGATSVTSRIHGGLAGSAAWANHVLSRRMYQEVSKGYTAARTAVVVAAPFAVGPNSSLGVDSIPNHMGTLYNCITLTINSGAVSGDRFICNGSIWAVPYAAGAIGSSPYLLRVGAA